MLVLALADRYETMWITALIIGAVVLVAVVALLSVLLWYVNRIDRNVREVWENATRLASNTATTWQLKETGDVLTEIKAEALRHDELLDSKL